MAADLDIVVLTWNIAEHVEGTLRALAESIRRYPGRCCTIIVDNGSDDGTLEEVHRTMPTLGKAFDLSLILPLGENLGISRGRNAGLEFSAAPLVMLLDGDISVTPEWIRALTGYLEEHPETASVGFYWNEFTRERDEVRDVDMTQAQITFPSESAVTNGGIYRRLIFDNPACLFPTQPPFDKPGYGSEDTWQARAMRENGFQTALIKGACRFYHPRSTSVRNLAAKGLDTRQGERRGAYEARDNASA